MNDDKIVISKDSNKVKIELILFFDKHFFKKQNSVVYMTAVINFMLSV